MKSNRQAGFTLLEMLIAVSMFALLSVGMAASLRISLRSTQKAQEHMDSDRRVLGVERALREQVSNLMPAETLCPVGGANTTMLPLFEGLPNTMRLVSSYSLTDAARGMPHLLEYRVIPHDGGAGFRLVVNEVPWLGPLLRGTVCLGIGTSEDGSAFPLFAPVQIGASSFVLADNLEYCRLSYQELRHGAEAERWLDNWTGIAGWPSAMRIEMRPLAPSSSRVELSDVTIPIRATSQAEPRP